MNWELAWAVWGVMLALFGAFSGLMLWMMSRMENRLHGDAVAWCLRLDAHIASSTAQFNAMNARIDATIAEGNARFDASNAAINARLDSNQATIIHMLEKSSKIG